MAPMHVFYLHGFASSPAVVESRVVSRPGWPITASRSGHPISTSRTSRRSRSPAWSSRSSARSRRWRRVRSPSSGRASAAFVARADRAPPSRQHRSAGPARAGARLRRQPDARPRRSRSSTSGAGPTGSTCSTTAFGRIMPVHFELYADAQRYDSLNAASETADPDLPGQAGYRRRPGDGRALGAGAAERGVCASSTTTTSCWAVSTTSGNETAQVL